MEQIKIRNIRDEFMKKSINLVNVKIEKNELANIEFLYKTNKEVNSIKAYLEDKSEKYYFNVKQY